MGNRKLSVIIVNYQSKKHLAKCLASIEGKIFPRVDAEIILVNNDPKEDVSELGKIKSSIQIINNRSNRGFGAACNLGVKVAQGEALLFLNPDAEVLSENIGEIIVELEKNNAGIVGARLVDENQKTHPWSAGKKINLYDLLRNNLRFPRSRKIWTSKNNIYCDWVSGTALFVKKDIFEKIKGFDEKFFMYFEDIDLCKRATDFGHRVLYFPDFQVIHLGGESYDDKKLQKKHYYASQEYYFKKHCGTFQTVFLMISKIFLGKR